jgi:hypothetical protein
VSQASEPMDAARLAAIVAAVEATWPRPDAQAADGAATEPSLWRFSARWWSRPAVSRRSRPW